MSISNGLVPYISLSKDGKNAVYEWRNGRKGVYFPPESAFFFCKQHDLSTFPFCTLNFHVNLYICRQVNGINRLNERTNNNIIKNCSLSGIVLKFSIVSFLHFLRAFSS